MKFHFTVIILFIASAVRSQNCTCDYSFEITNDTVTFTNQSSVSNPHYYWNFGDGLTSRETNPIHIFPESGHYLVTLYARDTVSNCHTWFENWFDIAKASTDSCVPFTKDSFIVYMGDDYLVPVDYSMKCDSYNLTYGCGYAEGIPPGNWLSFAPQTGLSSALVLLRATFSTFDTINGKVIHRQYYNTIPYHYYSSLNYDSCSANFEFYIDEQQDGMLVSFIAMNKNAVSYDFLLPGMGNTIHFNTSSASFLSPYSLLGTYALWMLGLQTEDANGCRDTVWQQILLHDPNYHPIGIEEIEATKSLFSIFPNPTSTTITLSLPSNQNTILSIFNLLGEKVKEEKVTGTQVTMDVSSLPQGLYLVRMENGVVGKFVKE